MRYRTDRIILSESRQLLGFADWIGGPTLSRVSALCPDGLTRWAHVSSEPDTAWTAPAYVSTAGRKVSGFLAVDNGIYRFTSAEPVKWGPVKPLRLPKHIKSVDISATL